LALRTVKILTLKDKKNYRYLIWFDYVDINEDLCQEFGADYGMPVGNKVREKLRKLQIRPGFPSEMVMKVRVLRAQIPTIDISIQICTGTRYR
jgi:hypothetical protein